MEITGEIIYVNPVKTPNAAKPDFQVQEFGIKNAQEVNFQMVEKLFGFQTAGERNKMLIGIGLGDKVKVVFGIRGTSKDKTNEVGTPLNPNNTTIFTSLDAFNISVIEKNANAPVIVTGQGVANTAASSRQTKPDIIPEGYQWNEEKGILEETPPF